MATPASRISAEVYDAFHISFSLIGLSPSPKIDHFIDLEVNRRYPNSSREELSRLLNVQDKTSDIFKVAYSVGMQLAAAGARIPESLFLPLLNDFYPISAHAAVPASPQTPQEVKEQQDSPRRVTALFKSAEEAKLAAQTGIQDPEKIQQMLLERNHRKEELNQAIARQLQLISDNETKSREYYRDHPTEKSRKRSRAKLEALQTEHNRLSKVLDDFRRALAALSRTHS